MASNRVPPLGSTSASTSAAGVVQLTDSTSSTSTTTAATPNAVKSAYDLANGAIAKTLTTTTGDIIYASGANTPARLGIGSTDQVLKVSGGVPTWSTPSSGGGLTLLATASPSAAASFNFTSISGSYKNLVMYWKNFYASAGGTFATMKLNNDSGSQYDFQVLRMRSQGTSIASDSVDEGTTTSMMGSTKANQAFSGQFGGLAVQTAGRGWLRIWDYTTTTGYINYDWHAKSYDNTVPNTNGTLGFGGYANSAAITRIDVTASGGTLTGTCYLYGES